MNQKKNHYQILGIQTTSSINEIKMAFKQSIRKHHPDKNILPQQNYQQNILNHPNDKKEISMKIIEAYQCLSDPQKKKLYDQQLKTQNLKSQLIQVRHKDTISLSKHNSTLSNTYNNLGPHDNHMKNGNIKLRTFNELVNENGQNYVSGEEEQEDSTIFVCQQCFGQNQILNKQLQELYRKELSINCQNCGLYMTVVE